jgi:hypothetical protein
MNYVTVFLYIKNAAYLTHLLLKASRFRKANKNFRFFSNLSLVGPLKKTFLGACSSYRASRSQYFDFS